MDGFAPELRLPDLPVAVVVLLPSRHFPCQPATFSPILGNFGAPTGRWGKVSVVAVIDSDAGGGLGKQLNKVLDTIGGEIQIYDPMVNGKLRYSYGNQ
jgi:hypothetical protein